MNCSISPQVKTSLLLTMALIGCSAQLHPGPEPSAATPPPAIAEKPATAAGPDAWLRHDSPTSAMLHNSLFLDDQRGWIFGHNSGEILRTDDDGKSWQIVATLAEGLWPIGDGGAIFSRPAP